MLEWENLKEEKLAVDADQLVGDEVIVDVIIGVELSTGGYMKECQVFYNNCHNLYLE